MRYREEVGNSFLPKFGITDVFDCVTSFRSIEDVNNGRKGNRPNSPCLSINSTYTPTLITQGTYGGRPEAVFAHASLYAGIMVSDYADLMGQHYDAADRKIKKLIAKQLGEFSTLNFLYELKDLPSLFKKIRRPQDFRYIDYAFAIAPMLSDLRNALTAYNNQVADLNRKLEKFKSINVSFLKRSALTDYGQREFLPGQRHTLSTRGILITRASGTIDMDIPSFSQVNPGLFSLLDDLQVDISAGNAYNAIPWSWFVDWFLPVGDFLEGLPSLMKPRTTFTGSISHKLLTTSDVYTFPYTNNMHYADNVPAGELGLTYYKRYGFNNSLTKSVKWKVDSLSSPSQVFILRDVMLSGRNKTIDKVVGNVAKRARAKTKTVFSK
jgi:hypothetical protein